MQRVHFNEMATDLKASQLAVCVCVCEGVSAVYVGVSAFQQVWVTFS